MLGTEFGVKLKDKVQNLRKHSRVFYGSRAVDWIVEVCRAPTRARVCHCPSMLPSNAGGWLDVYSMWRSLEVLQYKLDKSFLSEDTFDRHQETAMCSKTRATFCTSPIDEA